MVSIIYDGRAIPVYWELLPKLGSSNLTEQQRVFSKVLRLLTLNKTVILGDREFCSVELAKWLREKNLYFCLRLKKSEYIQAKSLIWFQLNEISLKPGFSIFLRGVRVRKAPKIEKLNLAGKWRRKREHPSFYSCSRE